jgi:hypothetical protein
LVKFFHISIKPLLDYYLKVCNSSTVFDANPRAELLRKRHTKRRINGDAATLRRFIQTHSKIFDQIFLAKEVRFRAAEDVTGFGDHEADRRIT